MNSKANSDQCFKIEGIILAFILCFAVLTVSSQKMDSLLNALSISKEDSNKVKIYNRLCFAIRDTATLKATEYALAQLELSKKIDYLKGEISALTMLGNLYFMQGNYNLSTQYHFKRLKIAESTGDKPVMAICYNNIGNNLVKNEEYEKALIYYNKCLNIKIALNDQKGLAFIYNNLASVYSLMEKFDRSLEYNLKSIEIKKRLNNKKELAMSYANVGSLYLKMENCEQALSSFLQSLAIDKELQNDLEIAKTHINISALYDNKKEYTKALAHLDSGLNFLIKSNHWEWVRKGFECKAAAYKGLKEYQKANLYLNKYIQLNDSLFNIERAHQISELQAKYETEAKNKNILLLEKENALLSANSEKRKLYAIITSISAMLLLTILLLFIIRSRSRKKHQLIELARNKAIFEQKALRAQMNPHFIFNSLNSIQKYILQDQSQEAYDYLAKFSKLIRQVLMNSERSSITIKDEVELLKLYVEIEQRRFKNRFEYSINYSDKVPLDFKLPIMLVQPFVENAIWHGLMNLDKAKRGLLAINFELEKDNLKIQIRDNGIGREAAALKRKDSEYKSVGMTFTQKRLELLKESGYVNAKVEIIDLKDEDGRANGTLVEIKLPLIILNGD